MKVSRYREAIPTITDKDRPINPTNRRTHTLRDRSLTQIHTSHSSHGLITSLRVSQDSWKSSMGKTRSAGHVLAAPAQPDAQACGSGQGLVSQRFLFPACRRYDEKRAIPFLALLPASKKSAVSLSLLFADLYHLAVPFCTCY